MQCFFFLFCKLTQEDTSNFQGATCPVFHQTPRGVRHLTGTAPGARLEGEEGKTEVGLLLLTRRSRTIGGFRLVDRFLWGFTLLLGKGASCLRQRAQQLEGAGPRCRVSWDRKEKKGSRGLRASSVNTVMGAPRGRREGAAPDVGEGRLEVEGSVQGGYVQGEKRPNCGGIIVFFLLHYHRTEGRRKLTNWVLAMPIFPLTKRLSS